jgi:hypothetical protein
MAFPGRVPHIIYSEADTTNENFHGNVTVRAEQPAAFHFQPTPAVVPKLPQRLMIVRKTAIPERPHPFSKPLIMPTTRLHREILNRPVILSNPSFQQRVQKIQADLPFTTPLSADLHIQIVRSIFDYKGENWRPQQGWQSGVQLPKYHIICYATNGFSTFIGIDQCHKKRLREEWPMLRIMYLKVSIRPLPFSAQYCVRVTETL